MSAGGQAGEPCSSGLRTYEQTDLHRSSDQGPVISGVAKQRLELALVWLTPSGLQWPWPPGQWCYSPPIPDTVDIKELSLCIPNSQHLEDRKQIKVTMAATDTVFAFKCS